MRHPRMPDLQQMLKEANALLDAAGLEACESIVPVADGTTANPAVIGNAPSRRYVIKAVFRHPDTLEQQREVANALRSTTSLPIPEHYCCKKSGQSGLPLMIMEWMPGEQLRLVLPALSGEPAARLVRDWGVCVGRFHGAHPPDALRDLPAPDLRGLIHWPRSMAQRSVAAPSATDGPSELLQEALAYVERPGVAPAPRSALTLVKADQDIRDFLALPGEAAHISAMLDWERVGVGDPAYELAVIRLKLQLLDLSTLWCQFRDGYASVTTAISEEDSAFRFYLMGRALLSCAAGFPQAGRRVVAEILREVAG